mmetsp:Transcript_9950/g.16116  ORF Transcript_9950/g.16116 Transcript_9950/m.16116 type:complete len:254 (-) Transcript_9950:15-776(-)
MSCLRVYFSVPRSSRRSTSQKCSQNARVAAWVTGVESHSTISSLAYRASLVTVSTVPSTSMGPDHTTSPSRWPSTHSPCRRSPLASTMRPGPCLRFRSNRPAKRSPMAYTISPRPCICPARNSPRYQSPFPNTRSPWPCQRLRTNCPSKLERSSKMCRPRPCIMSSHHCPSYTSPLASTWRPRPWRWPRRKPPMYCPPRMPALWDRGVNRSAPAPWYSPRSIWPSYTEPSGRCTVILPVASASVKRFVTCSPT